MTGRRFPFEASFPEVAERIDYYVEQVFEALTRDPLTSFLVLPRGSGYVSYEVFVRGYDALAETTMRFESLDEDAVLRAVLREPMALIVLRAMLGLSPPEWASVTTTRTGERIDQGYARTLERSIRMDPSKTVGHTPTQATRIRALVSAACAMLREGALRAGDSEVHRLDKVDTARGLESLKQVASQGVRYEALPDQSSRGMHEAWTPLYLTECSVLSRGPPARFRPSPGGGRPHRYGCGTRSPGWQSLGPDAGALVAEARTETPGDRPSPPDRLHHRGLSQG